MGAGAVRADVGETLAVLREVVVFLTAHAALGLVVVLAHQDPAAPQGEALDRLVGLVDARYRYLQEGESLSGAPALFLLLLHRLSCCCLLALLRPSSCLFSLLVKELGVHKEYRKALVLCTSTVCAPILTIRDTSGSSLALTSRV